MTQTGSPDFLRRTIQYVNAASTGAPGATELGNDRLHFSSPSRSASLRGAPRRQLLLFGPHRRTTGMHSERPSRNNHGPPRDAK
eukprot:2247753-Alexandrium_andersonii.AAC.1